MSSSSPYIPRHPACDRFLQIRGFGAHLHCWGDPSRITADQPALFMVHGWMDVGASFQFLVDELLSLPGAKERYSFIVAPDWRGFGQSQLPSTGAIHSYWFPDYLADLDAMIDSALADAPPAARERIDLLGHSMGGNASMLYAGVRPERVRRLVNLEGFGMPDTPADAATRRYRRWLDQLKKPSTLKPYESLDAVAARMREGDPRLSPERAAWLAPHWAAETTPGQWELRADPAHKHSPPTLYRADEVLGVWREITAPMLWVEAAQTDVGKFWGRGYTREEFERRLAAVANVEKCLIDDSGHMLHHDQPAEVARHVHRFLSQPSTPCSAG